VVLGDVGPVWVQYVVAVGTLGAAIFAGAAAFVAKRSTDAARDLIALERGRDDRAADRAFWSHARPITLGLSYERCSVDGRQAYDVRLHAQNCGQTP
jgi:hypothetical protein